MHSYQVKQIAMLPFSLSSMEVGGNPKMHWPSKTPTVAAASCPRAPLSNPTGSCVASVNTHSTPQLKDFTTTRYRAK